VKKTAAAIRSLSGPARAGASKKTGAFSFETSTGPPSSVGLLVVRERSHGDLPFSGAVGEKRRPFKDRGLSHASTSHSPFALAHSSTNRAHFEFILENMSVAPVTMSGDPNQSGY